MASALGKVRWGVLGTARIAVQKVIPAMQRGERSEVTAIASRDPHRARDAAASLGIAAAYGSYERLLADPDVEAVYIPLPNHLHVSWSLRAAEAGKHVLCEKPLALAAADVEGLIAARDRTGVLIQEAFMIRMHPQWETAIGLVRAGRIGTVRAVTGHFSYRNLDPANIRNIAAYGGGGLMDIGCYLVHAARWVFGAEPDRVLALIERDTKWGIDRLTSMLLDFEGGQAAVVCGTQLVPYQRVHISGTDRRIEVVIPFNAPSDRPCRIVVDDGTDVAGGAVEILEFEACDQYTLQGDAVSRAIRDGLAAPLPLEDSLANTRAMDAAVRSAGSGTWARV
jgi:predicted dehydrogenase